MLFRDLSAPILVIVGPTAVGKSELSIQLALRLNGEIVSADSRTFYRGMDIGTAKPSIADRKAVLHHLVDVADPDEVWSLAMFQKAARQAIADIHKRGKLPILVGGTGQYIRAVIEEWKLPAQPPDYQMRSILERWAEEIGAEGLYARLGTLDPQAASHIEERNLRRTVRALEVIFHTGRLFSSQRQRLRSPYQRLVIGLRRPRPELYERVDRRIDAMLAAGWLEEMRGLLARGYPENLPTFSAIGYRELVEVLQGKLTLEDAGAQMKRITRQFIRRQANWFKENDPGIHWLEIGVNTIDDMETIARTADWISDANEVEAV